MGNGKRDTWEGIITMAKPLNRSIKTKKISEMLYSGRFPTTTSCGTFIAGGQGCTVTYEASGVYDLTFDKPPTEVCAVSVQSMPVSGNFDTYEGKYQPLSNETQATMASGVRLENYDVDVGGPADVTNGELSFLISVTYSAHDAK